MTTLEATTTDRPGGVIRLLAAVAVVALLWLVLLPRLSRLPSVQARSEWLDERGIDPAAMYYTELEAMEPILHRLERRRRGLPATSTSGSSTRR
ncbi:hypothetical protein Mal4_08840 [Maioricimonas rarisocia]|uniref:Uncharacterized protein n=1 Tax=Maioricimonas rarisocia TaxID=2528026 RepID=A0A517Z2A5_9PLAN|nr:hypothetical protein [Maioricimonas rarisocia]QDU36597.1 hypothetical protein Mal4_08840 [Maioricimonas rarisocia]